MKTKRTKKSMTRKMRILTRKEKGRGTMARRIRMASQVGFYPDLVSTKPSPPPLSHSDCHHGHGVDRLTKLKDQAPPKKKIRTETGSAEAVPEKNGDVKNAEQEEEEGDDEEYDEEEAEDEEDEEAPEDEDGADDDEAGGAPLPTKAVKISASGPVAAEAGEKPAAAAVASNGSEAD